MADLSEQEIERIRAEIDDLVERLSDVLDGETHGIVLSAFGHIIGTSATDWMDLVRRCTAVTEMGAIVFHERNAPTEH